MPTCLKILSLVALVLTCCGVTLAADKPANTPRFDPVRKNIEGWNVDIDPALLEGKHREKHRDDGVMGPPRLGHAYTGSVKSLGESSDGAFSTSLVRIGASGVGGSALGFSSQVDFLR